MQTTNHVLMVRPARFQSNPDTAASNGFQRAGDDSAGAQSAALAEFEAFLAALRAASIRVTVVDDTPEPHTPDAIFPNNWISCDREGRVFLYPMEAPNRRLERRFAVLAALETAYQIREVVDLGPLCGHGHYLEGTGSLVFDHAHRRGYVCRSSRSHPAAAQALLAHTGYQLLWFDALDRQGLPIYHTNVMLSVGRAFAVVCLDAIADPAQRSALCAALHASGKQLIAISLLQMEQFAANMLELQAADGSPVLVMSRRAWAAFDPGQRAQLAGYGQTVLAPIDTIERLGGGGARCMLAEIFLPAAVHS